LSRVDRAAVPDNSDRMLHVVVAKALAFHAGRQEPTIVDRRLAAKLLTAPGSPLDRFEAHQFETNGDPGLDAQAIIG
jgi:hypothetical protein